MIRLFVAVPLLAGLLVLGSVLPLAAQGEMPPLTWPDLTPVQVANGFTLPVHIADAGDGSGRLFVVEKRGTVRILQDGKTLETPFLDISGRVNAVCNECGLLSIAFPPDFAQAGYFFVNYTAKANLAPPDEDTDNDTDNDTVIARFRVSADPNVADSSSEEYILLQNQPYTNHNGGLILFGPDGYLYIGMGDGGGGGDPDDNAQDPGALLGKMLRVEVGATGSYTVPEGNPFVDLPDYRAEIWALGLRNPWRFSFDRQTGDLWIADVGQSAYEEVNYQPAGSTGGQNYGWNEMEGKHCYAGAACSPSHYTLPIAEYPHDGDDCSVTGGVVYHSDNPAQPPVYLYADLCSGRVRALQRYGAAWEQTILMQVDYTTVSFGEDAAGRVYLVDMRGGIYRLSELVAHYLYHLPFLSTPAGDTHP